MTIDSTTGNITVANKDELVPGEYFVSVISTNPAGEEVVSTVNITVGNPMGTVLAYATSDPKALADYRNNDELAYVDYPDSTGNPYEGLTSATYRSGELPPGTNLNRTTGAIRVTNAEYLIPGSYTAQITLTDIDGTVTQAQVTIAVGIAPEYRINLPKNEKSYVQDEVLATPIVPSGTITAAAITGGGLVVGTSLDAVTGVITVSNPALLAGQSSTVEITITVENNGTANYPLSLTLEFLADAEAVYTVNAAKRLGELVQDEVLATVLDDDGPIVRATLTGGGLPPGVALNAENGTITVADITLVGPGTFSGIGIETEDIAGGTTQHTIAISILPQSYFFYQLAASQDVANYSNGDPLATLVESETGALQTVGIVEGVLPPGAAFDGATGNISVESAANLAPGTYALSVQTTDSTGSASLLSIELILLGAGQSLPIPEGSVPLVIPAWDVVKSYEQNEVTRLGDLLYVSITNNNTGNQPDTASSDWLEVSPSSGGDFGKAWEAATYAQGAVVRHNDFLWELTVASLDSTNITNKKDPPPNHS